MLKGVIIKLAIAAGAVVVAYYPISHEPSARAAIRGMINTLDANDAAALKAWPGSAESVIAMLHDRCMRAHLGDIEACTRYQSTN
jgi:hypothetical protein